MTADLQKITSGLEGHLESRTRTSGVGAKPAANDVGEDVCLAFLVGSDDVDELLHEIRDVRLAVGKHLDPAGRHAGSLFAIWQLEDGPTARVHDPADKTIYGCHRLATIQVFGEPPVD